MRLEHRRLQAIRESFPATVQLDLLNQANSWDSILESLSADMTKPEARSSAVLLRNSQYFINAKQLLNTSQTMESIARDVTALQRRLAALRTQRKEVQTRRARKDLRAHVRATLKECREGRKRIWVHELAFSWRRDDLSANSDFYNEHLGRIGVSSNSLLRPEALFGCKKTETTPDGTGLAPQSNTVVSKPLNSKGRTRPGADGIDPLKEPERWLEHLPNFVVIDGQKKNKTNYVKGVLRITSAPKHQLVAATLFYGYLIMLKAPVARYLGIERKAVQQRLKGFQNHARKQDPNWAEHLPGEQDVFRGRMASRTRE